MRRIGLQNVRLIETPGNPVVYGDWLGAPGAPTILFYGHYDVQPVDPLELWESPPFEATVRDGEIYARGVGRRQGPGVHALQGDRGAPEAERPPAGEHQDHPRRRGGSRQRRISTTSSARTRTSSRADVVVISDSPMFDRGVPSICYGLRGLVYFQIDLRGTKSDLHSGSFGGAVANPAFVLAQILAQMKDRGGRIKIPGLLRRCACRCRTRSAQEWKKLPFNETQYREGARRAEAVRRDAATRRSSASGRGRRSR